MKKSDEKTLERWLDFKEASEGCAKTTSNAMILAGVFAVALELCKFAFFPVAAAQLNQGNKLSAAALGLLSFLLLMVSIYATVVFLETGTTRNIEHITQSSGIYQQVKNTITNIDQQISTVNALMAEDLSHGYRQRSYANLPALQQLRHEKTQAVDRLQSLQITTSGVQSLFASIASQTGASAVTVRLSVYATVAVLVDICGITCLLLLAGRNAQKTFEEQLEKQPEKQLKKRFEEQPDEDLITQHSVIRDAILQGDFGRKPSVRKVMVAYKISYPTASKCMQQLLADNELTRVGQRYELVGEK